MGYRYIGTKTKIRQEIMSEITKIVPEGSTISDLMCGMGTISLELRKRGYIVIATDIMSQACYITKVKLLIQKTPLFAGVQKYLIKQHTLSKKNVGYSSVIETLNNLSPIKGYFWKEFSPDGKPDNNEAPRKYFTSENAQKIDAARLFIKTLKDKDAITELEYSLLVNDLIMATNDIANIAGTYGHYLSKFVSRALQPLKFTPTTFEQGGLLQGHNVIQGRAETLASTIHADLCYIDPPYTKRQYAANYHLLETIANGDEPKASGKVVFALGETNILISVRK